MNLSTIKTIVGFGFIVLGVVWSIFSRYLCSRMVCGVCGNPQLSPCYFEFLFVGIIFVLSGASLVLRKE